VVNVHVQRGKDGWTCDVTVDQAGQSTRHAVSVSRHDLERWGRSEDAARVEDLVRRSFQFLLERESPRSILGRFDLAVIQRYFPDYDQHFKR